MKEKQILAQMLHVNSLHEIEVIDTNLNHFCY
jgi:hypothetical protein